ncbi:MAG TPA: hypothetical protein VJW20_11540 [Candidatus Angelobacter sp.]|nr:hypothetical protein [Candidatus Angelobacter sp.]
MDTYQVYLLNDMVILVLSLAFVGWIIYLTAGLVRRRQQSAMQKHLLERFSSAQDFAQFIQSPAGQKYVTGFTDVVTSPRNSIVSSVRTGCVLAFGGIGCIAGSNSVQHFQAGWIVGWIAFLSGIGFLVSAVISYFLAKKLGLKEEV